MSRPQTNRRRRDAGLVTPCGVGCFYEVSPRTVGVLAPKSAQLDRYLRGTPGAEVLPSVSGMVNVIVPLIHMPEISRVLRDPPSAEAIAARRSRLW